MSGKAENLSKLLRSKAKKFLYSALRHTTASPAAHHLKLKLKQHISSPNTTHSSFSPFKPSQFNRSSFSQPLTESQVESLGIDLSDLPLFDLKEAYGEQHSDLLDTSWFKTRCHNSISVRDLHLKELSREKKQKWVFKSSQESCHEKLVQMCSRKFGADAAFSVFGKLGSEMGIEEFNAVIRLCIENARNTDDDDITLEELHRAFIVFETMREQGFQIGEETYGPFLRGMIDMGMVEEFCFFCDYIKKENPRSISRLAYYEMLLWTRAGDKDKIQMLITNTDDSEESTFRESYLVALLEDERDEEVLKLLEIVDIKKVPSLDLDSIFKSLGRLQLEFYVVKFIFELKTDDDERQDLSNLIYSYVTSIPNILIEDIRVKFKNLQAELKVASSPVPYEKLIRCCCDSLEVHVAIEVVDQMFEEGLTVPINTLNSILTACYTSCEYNLVHRIYSMINRRDLKPSSETFKNMIRLCVKLKDFDGAYGMIKDLEKRKLKPTANMYNSIMGGYFLEKNFHKGLMVLKQMDAADVKPDSQTFSFIIGSCNNEDDIVKYRKELHESGVQPTKHIFMALIHAYAACGLFDKARQVVLDKGIPSKSLNEIKSVLVSALALNGQMADALEIYDEIIQAEANLEPKAILSLIDRLQSEGELSRLLQLLEQLQDSELWDDGCVAIILYCTKHKLLGSAVDLLKLRMEKFCGNEMAKEGLCDEVFCQIAETEPADVLFGLNLLQAVKKDLGVRPSRRSLDFLLSACVNAKDLQHSFSVWKEYQTNGFPYNVLSFVRMYQALLASGAHKAAKTLLESIPDDDPHVCCVVKECQRTFSVSSASVKAKKTQKKKKKSKSRHFVAS